MPCEWEKTAQVSFLSIMKKKRKKDQIEELRFGFVSTSPRKQISLLALDSLPISRKITSFSLLPEGPLWLLTKPAQGTSGPAEHKPLSAENRPICNAFLQCSFPTLQPHKGVSVPICKFNNFYFLHLAIITHPPISGLCCVPASGLRHVSYSLQGPRLENHLTEFSIF